MWSKIKRLLLLTKNQTSKVNDFSAFLCMRRCKSLGLLKLFLWYASWLSRASILFFSILSYSQRVGVCCSGCWLDGEHNLLFTGMAGDILCLLKWQATFLNFCPQFRFHLFVCLFLRMVFRNQTMEDNCAHWYCGVTAASSCSQLK